jgi:hypothetical protein
MLFVTTLTAPLVAAGKQQRRRLVTEESRVLQIQGGPTGAVARARH